MHTIHTTPGLIIESRSSGEAGKVISIFTRDFGLVRAVAQGIRLEKSKLRYHVSDYSFGTFSLVRGKEYWRLTNAQGPVWTDVPAKVSHVESHKLKLIARISLLLKRLLHGEDAHPELFGHIDSCRILLANTDRISEDQLKVLESVTVLRIMHSLGYVGSVAVADESILAGRIDMLLLDGISEKRMVINQLINKALRESHL